MYTALGVSLVVLVILSILFYQRMNALIRYSDDADHAYNIVLQLEKLENYVKDVESTGRGYMLTHDTSFLDQMGSFNAEIQPTVDSLKELLEGDTALLSRLNGLNRLIRKRISLQNRNIHRLETNDTVNLVSSLNLGEYYMNQFRTEIEALRKLGMRRSEAFDRSKKNYEKLTPKFFNVILLFSVAITLIAFFSLFREIKIRLIYQKELEKRLLELNRSYAELEQFTFVASHDLQEPLRKIRTFSDRLITKYTQDLDPKAKNIIERMDVSARRLQELIHDITNFSALINKEETISVVSLDEIVERVVTEFKPLIVQRNVNISTDSLPVINGFPKQLSLLFSALVDNAIKFSNISDKPLVAIRYEMITKDDSAGTQKLMGAYHKIIIEDNGIGFDNEFADKIFLIFQRLHTQQSTYRGKGMGLAIAQRVMVNHNGFIVAQGNPGRGAIFSLHFPASPE